MSLAMKHFVTTRRYFVSKILILSVFIFLMDGFETASAETSAEEYGKAVTYFEALCLATKNDLVPQARLVPYCACFAGAIVGLEGIIGGQVFKPDSLSEFVVGGEERLESVIGMCSRKYR